MVVEIFRPWKATLICISIATFLSICFAFPSNMNPHEDTRIFELRDIQNAKHDKVVHLDDESYEKFVLSKDPRSYSLFIFFDASQLRQNPDLHLTELRSEFALASETYFKHISAAGKEPNLFFCDIEFNQAQKTFRKIGVSSLPHIRFIPSGKSSDFKLVNLNEFGRSAESLANYLKNVEGIDIGSIERPPLISTTMILIAVPFILLSLIVLTRWIFTRRTIFHDPRFWCVGALFIYFFSVSGGMHNIIRGMPMFIRDRQDPSKLVYFFQGSSTQLGVEGFTVGALYTAVGLLLAFATHYVPTVKDINLQRLYMLICIVGSILAVRQVVILDQWKTGYYIHAYWPTSWK